MAHLLLPSTKMKRRPYNQTEDVLKAGMSIKITLVILLYQKETQLFYSASLFDKLMQRKRV